MDPTTSLLVDCCLAHRDVEIEYVDQLGQVTRRKITPHAVLIDPEHGHQVKAWCHLRQDYRSFRTDRIRQIVRVHTGNGHAKKEELHV
jgi:predicted DNA-binding transcriptional regulator YafY